MESALLRCNTILPRPPLLPLCIPSHFHATNLQLSFRRPSCFSAGNGFRSYRADRQILRPVGFRFRSPSRQKEANEKQMAKRVERASLALACVIGIMSYSLWLKQEVVAAPDIGKCSSPMESVAREGISNSKKPCPVIKVLFFASVSSQNQNALGLLVFEINVISQVLIIMTQMCDFLPDIYLYVS